jgi:glucose/arabinose dehydrogenase
MIAVGEVPMKNILRLILIVMLSMFPVKATVNAAPWERQAEVQSMPAPSGAPLESSRISFDTVVSGMNDPVFITHAGDGSGRIFVVERTGYIRIIENGVLLSTPFLDIDNLVKSSSGEQGALGLAFHPSYETNGYFYVTYTANRSGDSSGSRLILQRFSVSAGDPDEADPLSGLVIMEIQHPSYSNHNGGGLAFGNDGYLYWSTGDGGGGGDPDGNGQDLTSLLGKILRIDINSGSPYSVPSSNPFFSSGSGIETEIWAYGLRNPWRFSFDRLTHDLYIGDVGQSQREEIDFQAASSTGGENYGWKVMEGSLCYEPSSGCDQSGKVLPVAEYNHSVGCSITGGNVYRGLNFPSLRGYYFYADYCTGRFFALRNDISLGWQAVQLADTSFNVSTFGEDEQGELYLTDYGSGTIYNVQYDEPIHTISGDVQVGGIVLGYVDETSKTVTSLADGSYSLPVQSGWTGTVTPLATCYTFTPVDRDYSDVTADQTGQDYVPTAIPASGCAEVDLSIAGNTEGTYSLAPGASTRQSFTNINNGPVRILDSAENLIAAERVIYTVNGSATSFSEMMGLPASQLNTTYWLPWYNNVDLDTQLRIGNVSGVPAEVHVYIGGTEMPGSPFNLTASGAGQSMRVSFPGVNSGPVQIISDESIVAAERVIYTVNGSATSFSEMMGLPASQLNTTYWLPWYNNVDLDTQLRIGNVSGVPAEVHVYIGGTEMPGSPFNLTASGAGQSMRVSFPGVNSGPVQIISDESIVAAERVIYTVNGSATSFSEMMGLPASQLNTTYWLPWYNNVDLDTQLRFGLP